MDKNWGQGQLIAQQKLRIAKLQRQIYGHRSERSSRLIDPVGALTFEELEIGATEDELSAEQAVAKTTSLRGFYAKGVPNARPSPVFLQWTPLTLQLRETSMGFHRRIMSLPRLVSLWTAKSYSIEILSIWTEKSGLICCRGEGDVLL
ncbi:hypothetical protein CQ10_24210 [Bradyrhizobium valentinum]|uniref:Transposase TnpC homeodomain domain-containing protein n=1 Tax=Bradyrhizobium valentinum TaxID=1518501 RepID=A0A0R3L517_9BRAD|nr:hypothetical protein CQ10_24210 [Bradyrhizobium valentinum]KRR02137.1 hypothetical protein CP49_05045 [Bradyrhizobium valentinum]